jgi:uncharacterized protein YbjT (DUF2867 family)
MLSCRHPDVVPFLFSREVSGIEAVHADVNNVGSVARAVAGAWAIVNTVSLYVERGEDTFHAVHVEAAKRIAALARQAGAETLVHISGIGANAGSASPYIRSRGEGEAVVIDAFPSANLVRPTVMFGPDDAFLTPLLAMLRRLPVFPMFGSGATKLQPVYVEDVAEAVVRILRTPAASQLYELAGPRVYTYQELLRTLAASAGTRPFLVPFPFSLWHAIGYVAEALAGERLFEPIEKLVGRIDLIVMFAIGEDGHLVQVFGKPRCTLRVQRGPAASRSLGNSDGHRRMRPESEVCN